MFITSRTPAMQTARQLETTPGRKAITYVDTNGETYTDNWRSARRFVHHMVVREIVSITGLSPCRTGLFVVGGNGETRMADPDQPFKPQAGGYPDRARLQFINWAR